MANEHARWCVAVALLSAACGAASITRPTEDEGAGAALFSPDEDGLRGKLAACLGIRPATAVGWLLPDNLGGIPDTQRGCLAGARSCGDVQRCLGVEPGPCPPSAECDGNVSRLCWALRDRPELVESRDCSADPNGNHSCFVISGHRPEESFTECGSGSCTADACDEDALLRCINGVAVREDCTRIGKHCIGTSGVAFCGFTETCTESRCEGDTAVVCDYGQVVFRQPCQQVVPEASCIDQGAAVYCGARGVSIACDQAPDAPTERCVRDRAELCQQGIWLEVDCAAAGSSCIEQNPGWVSCGVPAELASPD
jgi:hypothetical protein